MSEENVTNKRPELSHEKLNDALVDFSELFEAVLERLNQFNRERSKALKAPGLVDPKPHLGSVMANQVFGECQYYYRTAPSSVAAAACWLQKAFALCRMFESEDHGEKKAKNTVVGDMVDEVTRKKFRELTAMSALTTDPQAYGQENLNPELQKLVNVALEERRPLDAIRYLCDSPKHGVLSSMVNLLFYKAPQQVYIIGLWAAGTAIGAWLERNKVSPVQSPQE